MIKIQLKEKPGLEKQKGVIMRRCPTCGRVYEDDRQVYCLNDGATLVRQNQTVEPTVEYAGSLNRQPFAAAQPPPAKKSNSLLILGGVGLLMFILFIGVVLTVGIIISFKKQNNPVNTANGNTQPTPVTLASGSDRYQPELKMAINSANNAQSTAYASLDASLLNRYYSGEALKSYTTDVENLKKGKIFQISTMQDQQFQAFKVNDAGNEAEVKVTETWETNVFQVATRKCLLYYSPTRIPQTVYLKKAQSGWVVDATVYDPGIKKAPQPCPKKK